MSRAKGTIAENLSVDFLVENGYAIIEQNFYSRFGEIDIIATKDDILHFIEVKSGLSYEQAIHNITPTKLQKLIKTIDVYLKKNALHVEYELDAIIVVDSECELIESITI